MASRTPRFPGRLLARLALCGVVLGGAVGVAAPAAHADTLKPGATGLHDSMMPSDSPDAQRTAGPMAASPQAASGQQTGVDVSRWQHPSGAAIDWGQVAASGQSFAIVKATELYSTSGGPVLYTNQYLSQDLAAARAAGLVVGSYAFAHPENSPITQADAFAAAIGTLPSGSLPPVLDLEVDGGLPVGQLVSWTQNFLSRLQQDTGIVPMIYAGPYFWSTSMGGSTAFTGYPLWEAHYTSAAAPAQMGGWSTYNLWQFTSTASIPGITGAVDQNRFNGASLTSLAQYLYPSTFSGPASMSGGQSLRSPNQQYTLSMQTDGNLVEYGNGRALWYSGTWGNNGSTLALQTDGNLVIYSPSGRPLWASGSSGSGDGSQLAVQDDGNVVFSVGGARVWSDGAPGSDRLTPGGFLGSGQYLHSPAGTAVLLMQGDGNLVLYRYGGARWATATNRYPGARAYLQGDGNIVIYDRGGVPRWSSQTNGSGGNQLVMQGDGNLVLYAPGRAVWATGTN